MEDIKTEDRVNVGDSITEALIDSGSHNELLTNNLSIVDIPEVESVVVSVVTNLNDTETLIVEDTLHAGTAHVNFEGNEKDVISLNGDDLCNTDLELIYNEDCNGFNTSDMNVTVIEMSESKSIRGGGSDSGLESTPVFHRTFSCNSGGYSSGGLDDLNKSCDSSLLSYSEDTELMTQSLTIFARDGTSEGGSESSAVDSDSKCRTPIYERNLFAIKKRSPKTNVQCVANGHRNGVTPITEVHQHSVANRRQNITPKKSGFVSSSPKTPTLNNTNNKLAVTPLHSSVASKSRSVSNLEKGHIHLKDSSSDPSKKKTPSGIKPKIAAKPTVLTPRSKTPKTEYDGRWPSSTNKTTTPLKPRPVETKKLHDVQTPKTNHIESKANALDRYGTLPRRSRRRSPDTSKESLRSFSVSREQSISRVRRNVREVGITKTLPPFPRRKPQKTRIYHEISIQTALTSLDIEKALEGVCFKEPRLDIEYQDQEVQVDRMNEFVDGLELELKTLREENASLKESADRQKEYVVTMKERLAEEKSAKDATKEELHNTEKRLQVMLGKSIDDGGANSLQELESHIQTSGKVVIRQQKEILNLQSINKKLHQDLEKSLATHKALIQQQKDIESETIEMQEFIQEEKSMLAEALIEAEKEVAIQKEIVAQKVTELERKQDECTHLVRISEQRRQENMMLQGRINGLDERSKDLLVQQGAAVSGAAVALSGLSSRLDGLVEQLVTSYDISEKDLEDVIFHNEAYSKSNSSSVTASPDKTLNFHQPSPSPKRRASFLTAVVKAIRNATNQSPFSKMPGDSMEAGQIAIKENGADKSASKSNENSKPVENSTEEGTESQLVHSESLRNLSQAILNRQHFEDGSEALDSMTYGGANEMLPESEDFSPGSTFIDQIIEVDNLVTRLLKVLRIIQLENDTNVDELQDERIRLEEEVRREQDLRRVNQDELRSLELAAARLRGEVQEAKMQLERRVAELEEAKVELHSHREQVRALTNENWKLSSALSQLENFDDEAKGFLQKWQESGDLPSPDSMAWMLTARDEIPALKEQLAEKEYQLVEIGHKFAANKELLSQNLHQAAQEIRRQYEAIDSALEILQSIQGVVHQCPPLAQLQRDLEETNFQCASSKPIIAADLNANAAPMSANDIHNVGLDVINNPAKPINSTAY